MNTEDIIKWLKAGIASIVSALNYFLGGFDMSLKVLIALTILDFITGILAAVYKRKVDSNIGYKGVIRKTGMYVMVCMAYLLDAVLGTTGILRGAMIGFYIAVEGISIVENTGAMGLPLPAFIKEVLVKLKTKSDNAGKIESQDDISKDVVRKDG